MMMIMIVSLIPPHKLNSQWWMYAVNYCKISNPDLLCHNNMYFPIRTNHLCGAQFLYFILYILMMLAIMMMNHSNNNPKRHQSPIEFQNAPFCSVCMYFNWIYVCPFLLWSWFVCMYKERVLLSYVTIKCRKLWILYMGILFNLNILVDIFSQVNTFMLFSFNWCDLKLFSLIFEKFLEKCSCFSAC